MGCRHGATPRAPESNRRGLEVEENEITKSVGLGPLYSYGRVDTILIFRIAFDSKYNHVRNVERRIMTFVYKYAVTTQFPDILCLYMEVRTAT